MSVQVQLYSSRICGWAKRNYAALLEKKVPFELLPANDSSGQKKPEFLALSPARKTPVLVHDGSVVWESRLINEYIEEAFPHNRLMPLEPALKARARNISYFCDDVLMPLISRIATVETLTTEADDLHGAMGSLEKFAFECDHEGPYWAGPEFSLVDICFLNFFDNLNFIAQKIEGLEVTKGPLLSRWGEAILTRGSVARAAVIARDFAVNETRQVIKP